jgi:hypothetical protein
MNVCKEPLGVKCIPCCQIFILGIKRCFLLFCIDVLNCRKLHKLVWFNSESKCKSFKEKEKTEKNKKKKRKERKWTEQPGLAQQQRPANRTETVTPSLYFPTDRWSPPASLTSRPHRSDPSSTPAVSSPPAPETAWHDLPFPLASRDQNGPRDNAPLIPLLSLSSSPCSNRHQSTEIARRRSVSILATDDEIVGYRKP